MQRDDRLRNRAELGIRTEHSYLLYGTFISSVCMLNSVVQQPKAIYLANPVSPDKVFFSADCIYILGVYNKIQVGVELLPLGNLRNSRWRPT